jgi:acyl-CoA synthetase (AMP-forming)/AMP-acid ligase II
MYVTQALHRAVQQNPDQPHTIFGDRVRTFAESADRIARLASALRSVGVGTDDRVGILSLNSGRGARCDQPAPGHRHPPRPHHDPDGGR